MIKKKAAIEVSATAIVTIILAFVFLGLAIMFVRNIMGQSEGTVDDFFASLGIVSEADARTPLVFPERVNVRYGRTTEFGVRVYNPNPGDIVNASPFIGDCMRSDGTEYSENSAPFAFITPRETIISGREQAFRGSIRSNTDQTVSDLIPQGSREEVFVCSVYVRWFDGSNGKWIRVSEIASNQVRITLTT
ncbi:MAG TPA: hypothetical protein ENN46_01355 [Candidatus Woesearchaeota archaeon]|nr:hypothetical protein [Candidatus Woesearchaeota archaeon]